MAGVLDEAPEVGVGHRMDVYPEVANGNLADRLLLRVEVLAALDERSTLDDDHATLTHRVIVRDGVVVSEARRVGRAYHHPSREVEPRSTRSSFGECWISLERQLPTVVLEVLCAVVVHVKDAHHVPEVGVPGGRKMHTQPQGLLRCTGQAALDPSDGP